MSPSKNEPRRGLQLQRADFLTMLLALFTGLLIWFYVDSRRTEDLLFLARVELAVPAGWRLEGGAPKRLAVRLRGPQQVVGALSQDQLRFVRALSKPSGDLAEQEIHLELTAEDLRGLPSDVAVLTIEEPQLTLRLSRPVRRYVPVKVEFAGKPAEGYRMQSHTVTPKRVAVNARASEQEALSALVAQTFPLNLDGRQASFGSTIDLQPLRVGERLLYPGEPVFVEVTMSEQMVAKTFASVPVSIYLATPLESLAGGRLSPSQVSVTVRGYARDLAELKSSNLSVYIDTRDMGSSVQGEYTLPCRLLEASDFLGFSCKPASVRWAVPQKSAPPAVTPPAAKALPPQKH